MGEAFKFLLWLGIFALIAGTIARKFFVDVALVTDNGMAPTLVYGDEVLVWRGAPLDRGDVALCPHPTRSGLHVIGRVVALPGESLQSDHLGALYIGGNRMPVESAGMMEFYDVTRKKQFTMHRGEMQYSTRFTAPFFIERDTTFSMYPYTVKKGVYLMGDNRSDRQHDSRSFGEVDPDKCQGQVFMRWKPAPPTGDGIDHGYLDWIK